MEVAFDRCLGARTGVLVSMAGVLMADVIMAASKAGSCNAAAKGSVPAQVGVASSRKALARSKKR